MIYTFAQLRITNTVFLIESAILEKLVNYLLTSIDELGKISKLCKEMLQKFIFLKINKNKPEYKWFQEVLRINYSVWWKLYHLESAIVINNLLESNQIY